MSDVIKRLRIILVLLIPFVVNAQEEPLKMATFYLQNGNLDSAKIAINHLINDPQAVKDGNVWYLRGFIYKSIYNKWEKADKQSPARMEALKSFKLSFSIDTAKATIQENKKNIKYLVTTLFNDAATSLDSMDYKLAIETFEQFKEYYILIDTSQVNFKQTNIKFLLALATVYTTIFDGDKKGKAEFLKLAKDTYNKILALDPNNITANYNMGILYYSQAINLINQLDYGVDLLALNDAQDNSISLFRESLPFMEKAYALDPKRKDTLYGLSGIYYSLNEIEKSNEFKQKLEEIKKQ
jgi:tetratricopeptide (TPR) repeat protein